jgi:hypothetical protein
MYYYAVLQQFSAFYAFMMEMLWDSDIAVRHQAQSL